ncbi:MAG TPA: SH3 domain-containing protein, partial [Anaerolineales bacterium]|nr:SH3 domain-containing protein [Anaerolineales bacterium]
MTSSRPNPPAGGPPLGAIAGIVVLALIGVAMLVYSLSSVFGAPGAAPTSTAEIVAEQPSPTQAILLPTTTPVPPTEAPSATADAATEAPPAEVGATSTLPSGGSAVGDLHVMVVAANVRAAPNAESILLGTIDGGSSAKVLGRNEAGDWLAVDFNGQLGWVSTTVATFTGDDSALPVLAPDAGAQPQPTATTG